MNWLGLPAEGYFAMDTRFGRRSIEIHLHKNIQDGKVYLFGSSYLWIGTGQIDFWEAIRREGRLLVREGLKDVLEWLGEDWYNEPTGEEIYEMFAQHGQDAFQVLSEKTRTKVQLRAS